MHGTEQEPFTALVGLLSSNDLYDSGCNKSEMETDRFA
jgi:hypothetical protein